MQTKQKKKSFLLPGFNFPKQLLLTIRKAGQQKKSFEFQKLTCIFASPQKIVSFLRHEVLMLTQQSKNCNQSQDVGKLAQFRQKAESLKAQSTLHNVAGAPMCAFLAVLTRNKNLSAALNSALVQKGSGKKPHKYLELKRDSAFGVTDGGFLHGATRR